MNKKIILIFIMVFLIFGAWLFQDQRETSQENHPKICALLPLTGGAAQYGKDALNGLLLAQEDLKSRGKSQSELMVLDTKSTVKGAISAFHKAQAAKVDSCLVMLSGLAKAVAPIAQSAGVFLMATVAAAPKIFPEKAPAFRWYYSGRIVSEKIGSLISKRNYKAAAIIAENIDYSSDAAKTLKSFLHSKGINSSIVTYSTKSLDARSIVVKALDMSHNPDVVVLLGSGGKEAGRILKAIAETGFTGAIVSDDSVSFPDVLDVAGRAANGVIFVASAFNGKDERNDFVRRYKERYGKEPTDISAFSHDIALLLNSLAGLPDAQSKFKALAQALNSFHSVFGDVTADIKAREISVPMIYKRIVLEGKNHHFESIEG